MSKNIISLKREQLQEIISRNVRKALSEMYDGMNAYGETNMGYSGLRDTSAQSFYKLIDTTIKSATGWKEYAKAYSVRMQKALRSLGCTEYSFGIDGVEVSINPQMANDLETKIGQFKDLFSSVDSLGGGDYVISYSENVQSFVESFDALDNPNVY